MHARRLCAFLSWGTGALKAYIMTANLSYQETLFFPFWFSESPTVAERRKLELRGSVIKSVNQFFLIFKYVNEKDISIVKLVLKVVNDSYTGLKIGFKLGVKCTIFKNEFSNIWFQTYRWSLGLLRKQSLKILLFAKWAELPNYSKSTYPVTIFPFRFNESPTLRTVEFAS